MQRSPFWPLPYLVVIAAGLLGACGPTSLLIGTGDDSDGGGGNGARDLGMPDLLTGPPCANGFCRVGEVCELGGCHADCGMNLRCGAAPDERCCAGGEVCYLGGCVVPGAACGNGAGSDGGCGSSTCPDGQYCEGSLGRCLPLAKIGMCEYRPPPGSFSPKVKWEWTGSKVLPTYNQVMMTPVVGDIDGDCVPDVVFSTFAAGNYTVDGVVRAVRGDGSRELFTVMDPALRVGPGAQLAIADVDGDGKMEIFGCATGGQAISLSSTGTKRWLSADKPCLFDAPAIADVDHDGKAEVIIGFAVYDALTGALKNKPPVVPRPMIGASPYGYFTTAAEMDNIPGNGLEIVAGGAIRRWDGTIYWDKSGGNIGYPAIADLDGDGRPDVVSVVPGTHQVYAYQHDGTLLWGPVDVNNGVATPKGATGGGPPTIADFDGDGNPDVATAGGYGYLVLSGRTGKVLWHSTATTDTSSRVTGSSVFDFEGDGPAEAVYNDEHNLRVYRGADGKVLVKLCSTSGTLWEYPVIVDVDGDDHAEIVVMDNNYSINMCDMDLGGGMSHSGFKVIGDAMNRWVRTRRIWNQHAYHVTNVADDGTIPKDEAAGWAQPGLNSFRQNVQTKNLFNAPDLVPRDLRSLPDKCGDGKLLVVATVFNQGAATAPSGLPVTFYLNMGGVQTVIGTVATKDAILAGAAENVSIEFTPAMGVDPRGPFSISVIVDDAGKPQSGVVNECDEANNASLPTNLGCPQIG